MEERAEERKTAKRTGREREREVRVGPCVFRSVPSSSLHRGLGTMPLRNLCLLYGQENKEASY